MTAKAFFEEHIIRMLILISLCLLTSQSVVILAIGKCMYSFITMLCILIFVMSIWEPKIIESANSVDKQGNMLGKWIGLASVEFTFYLFVLIYLKERGLILITAILFASYLAAIITLSERRSKEFKQANEG